MLTHGHGIERGRFGGNARNGTMLVSIRLQEPVPNLRRRAEAAAVAGEGSFRVRIEQAAASQARIVCPNGGVGGFVHLGARLG